MGSGNPGSLLPNRESLQRGRNYLLAGTAASSRLWILSAYSLYRFLADLCPFFGLQGYELEWLRGGSLVRLEASPDFSSSMRWDCIFSLNSAYYCTCHMRIRVEEDREVLLLLVLMPSGMSGDIIS
jgi:hypothetical protein